MITLTMFILATIGLTNILVHGKVLDLIKIGDKSLRGWMKTPSFLGEMLDCYECTGFWAGLLMGLIFFWGSWLFVLTAAFAGSVVAQTYTDLMYLLRSKIDFVVEDSDAQEERNG